jgi:hypothetical protein
MVTPTVKREAVAHLKSVHEMSERRRAGDRMMMRYSFRRPDDPACGSGRWRSALAGYGENCGLFRKPQDRALGDPNRVDRKPGRGIT